MSEPGRVIIIGSVNADLVVRAPRHPLPGETLLGISFTRGRGGKGANQAVACSRAGAPTTMVGRLGDDPNGADARAGLVEAGVDVTWLGTCRHDPTGVALVTVADSGENTIVVVPGANAMLRAVHVHDAAAGGAFAKGGVVLAQLEVDQPVVLAALECARERGLITVLNAAPASAVPAAALALVDFLVVNEHEWSALEPNSGGFAGTVVQTLGGEGARWWGTAGSGSAPSHRVEVVDSTGAGDAFCGHFVASLAKGRPFLECVQRAVAAGALACTIAGAQPSLPDAQAVDELLLHADLAGRP